MFVLCCGGHLDLYGPLIPFCINVLCDTESGFMGIHGSAEAFVSTMLNQLSGDMWPVGDRLHIQKVIFSSRFNQGLVMNQQNQ